MRQVTTDIWRAFEAGVTFYRTSPNGVRDQVNFFDGYWSIRLWNRPIVQLREDGIYVSDGNYRSRTTKERLSGIVRVRQIKGVWYLYIEDADVGVEWDGDWIYAEEAEWDLSPSEKALAAAHRIQDLLDDPRKVPVIAGEPVFSASDLQRAYSAALDSARQ